MLLTLLVACRGASPDEVLAHDPTAPLQVRVYTGVAGAWVERPNSPVARAFTSLHAVVHDGELVVPGLRRAAPTWWEERFPRLFVEALVTRDLARWELRRWEVDAPGASLLDPAIVEGPEGLELWYVSAPGRGDPAEGRKPNTLLRAPLRGDRFGDAETWATGAGLVDVAPAWFGGRWRVFATRDHRDVVEVAADGVTTLLGGATVPFARVVGERLVVTAQRMAAGGMRPVEVVTTDGTTWSAPRDVHVAANDLRTCASPVTATLRTEEVLLCVDERQPSR